MTESLNAFFADVLEDAHEGRSREHVSELLMLHAEWTNGEIDAAECRRRVEAL